MPATPSARAAGRPAPAGESAAPAGESATRVVGVTKHYPWGRRAAAARVARYAGVGPDTADLPFAELWFGTHPSGTSPVAEGDGIDLAGYLGDSGPLPFILKILSIGRPLSLQVHPKAPDARRLHAEDPARYPDPCHKPEVAVALEEADALWGLRTAASVREVASALRAASLLTGDETGPRDYLPRLLRAPAEAVSTAVAAARRAGHRSPEDALALRLAAIFGDADPGVLAPYVMHHVRLAPGDSLFVPPGVPHAYLSGELLECMAASDNVVRAGLTDKQCDVTTALACVDTDTTDPLPYLARAGRGGVIDVPCAEFRLTRIDGGGSAPLPRGFGLLLCTEGPAAARLPDGARRVLAAGECLIVPGGPGPVSVEAGPGTTFLAAAGEA